MKKILIVLLLLPIISVAQSAFGKDSPKKEATDELNINEHVQGTLWLPENQKQPPLVILLTGSGPNDRDGNSPMTKNDSHKQLAKVLLENGIATYRYDKRVVTQIKKKKVDPDTSFDDFVTDAASVVAYFENDNRFSKIILTGHSQGSLVAMLAVNENVDGFISLAGSGEEIDKVIVAQVAKQAPGLDKIAAATFQKMRDSVEIITDVSPYLMSLQAPEMQPFMESWMAYDPAKEISKLQLPILIINGDRDEQVSVDQAQILKNASPDAQLTIIKGMNHVLKQVPEDDLVAAKSYSDPNFPIHPELVTSMLGFINKL